MLTCTNFVVCCACKWLTFWLSYPSLYESESNCEVVCRFLIGHLYPVIIGKNSLPYLETNFCSESKWHALFSSCLYHNFYDFLNNHEILAFEYGSIDCVSYVEHILDRRIFSRVYRSINQDEAGSTMGTWTRCSCTYKDCNKMP